MIIFAILTFFTFRISKAFSTADSIWLCLAIPFALAVFFFDGSLLLLLLSVFYCTLWHFLGIFGHLIILFLLIFSLFDPRLVGV